MASIVLTAAGYMAGGPIGAQIGGFIGSMIDQSIFAPPPAKGPRLNDLSVQASSYGNPIPRVYGAENRLSGNLIWSSGLVETENYQGGGKGGGGTSESITYTYHVDCAFGLCRGGAEGIVGIRRIWADGKLFMDEDGVQKQATEVRVYLGTEDQLPDPTIEAAVGVGATPAYRGLVYVVFEHLELADFGNRIPNFTFEVVAQTSATVATVIEDLCEAADVPYLDAARTDYLDLRGYMIGTASTIRDSLTPLRGAFFFDMSEIEGELQFFPVDGTPVAKVPAGDMGAHPFGTDRPANYDAKRISEEELPRQIMVQHMDPARDYQVNSQRSRRATVNSNADMSLQLPIVLTADEAKAIAEKMHYMAWLRRTKLNLQLPIDYLNVEPGQKIVVPCDDGRDRTLRVIRKETRLPGSIALECEADAASVLSRTAVASAAPVPAQEVRLPGVTVAHLMDLPILRDEDDSSGFYVAGNGASSGWRGAVLYRSLDAGLNYSSLVDLPVGAIIGTTQDVLAAGSACYWDEGHSVTIALLDPAQSLASASSAEVLNGANACAIGDEVLQFRTAELIAPATYRLSGLLRGRKGTEDKISGHVLGERFVFLSGAAGIYRPAIAASELGVARQYKAAANGTLLSDATPQTFTHSGRWAKPYAVAHVRGSRSGGDLSISWIRRTRFDAPWLDGIDAPLGEDAEAYEIDILNGGTVVRTITAATPAAVYTAANQITDFGGAQPAVTLRIYQISSRVGRGLPKEVTL